MTKFLLITANVGSIFEDRDGLLMIWVNEFLKNIERVKPTFIALHCQEVGGKKYEQSMKHVAGFVEILLNSKELEPFDYRIFLDEDFSLEDKFTALGNLYFVHKSETSSIWNFKDKIFIPIEDSELYTGNINHVPIKEKLKYPQNFFPQCKWSRKGFMKTRWLVNGIELDLINIHLFHDESNFLAVSEFPSAYTENRRRALDYTLKLIQENADSKDLPFFVFGDFNFRLDTKGIVNKLTSGVESSRRFASNGDITRLTFKDVSRVLTVEKKKFILSDDNFFNNPNSFSFLREFDRESLYFGDSLIELEINFPPSYPFEEKADVAFGSRYMNTRCPGWCDRVMMNQTALGLLSATKYDLMGCEMPMGDHKPVYLSFHLESDKLENLGINQQTESRGNFLLKDISTTSTSATFPSILFSSQNKVNDTNLLLDRFDAQLELTADISPHCDRSQLSINNNTTLETSSSLPLEEVKPTSVSKSVNVSIEKFDSQPSCAPIKKSSKTCSFSFKKIKSYCFCNLL